MVVGEKGFIHGNVECQNADVMGKIDGKLDVKGSLALRATSNLVGDISTSTLMVEPNALFNGSCTMGEKE